MLKRPDNFYIGVAPPQGSGNHPVKFFDDLNKASFYVRQTKEKSAQDIMGSKVDLGFKYSIDKRVQFVEDGVGYEMIVVKSTKVSAKDGTKKLKEIITKVFILQDDVLVGEIVRSGDWSSNQCKYIRKPYTDETTLPEDKTTLPEDETTLPEDEITMPEDKTTLPEDKIKLPEIVTPEYMLTIRTKSQICMKSLLDGSLEYVQKIKAQLLADEKTPKAVAEDLKPATELGQIQVAISKWVWEFHTNPTKSIIKMDPEMSQSFGRKLPKVLFTPEGKDYDATNRFMPAVMFWERCNVPLPKYYLSAEEAVQILTCTLTKQSEGGFVVMEVNDFEGAPWGYKLDLGDMNDENCQALLNLFLQKATFHKEYVERVRKAAIHNDAELFAELLTTGVPSESRFGCMLMLRNNVWSGRMTLSTHVLSKLHEQFVAHGVISNEDHKPFFPRPVLDAFSPMDNIDEVLKALSQKRKADSDPEPESLDPESLADS